jgi:hypothetical protein
MSTGGGGLLCCLLLLLQVCVAQEPSLISSSQLTGGGGQIGGEDDDLLVQDPIRRARLMSSHGRDDELGRGCSADSISDDGVDYTVDEYASVNRCVPVVTGRGRVVGYEEEEKGLLLAPDGGDDGGDSGGTTKGGSSGSGGYVECPECGKFFKNDKSMFGHLRSHPNRGYKGAIPPVKKLKLSPETAAVASAASSSSPTGTDPTPPAKRTSGRDPELTPLEILCACVLLTLKYKEHDTNDTTQQVPQRPPSWSSEKLDDVIGQAEEGAGAGEGSVVAGNNAATEHKCNNAGAEAAGNLENGDEHDGNSIVKIPMKRRNMIPKEVTKKAKLIVLPTPPKEKRPYACKHCKAEFPTNQALGGHVAGHHREKKVSRRLSDPSAAMAAESQNGKQRVYDGDDDDNNKDLSLRREQFSMALDVPSWQSAGQQPSGGKMRRHHGRRNDDGLSMATVAAAAPTPTPVDGGGGSARRPWNIIDLNVKAPEQE